MSEFLAVFLLLAQQSFVCDALDFQGNEVTCQAECPADQTDCPADVTLTNASFAQSNECGDYVLVVTGNVVPR